MGVKWRVGKYRTPRRMPGGLTGSVYWVDVWPPRAEPRRRKSRTLGERARELARSFGVRLARSAPLALPPTLPIVRPRTSRDCTFIFVSPRRARLRASRCRVLHRCKCGTGSGVRNRCARGFRLVTRSSRRTHPASCDSSRVRTPPMIHWIKINNENFSFEFSQENSSTFLHFRFFTVNFFFGGCSYWFFILFLVLMNLTAQGHWSVLSYHLVS